MSIEPGSRCVAVTPSDSQDLSATPGGVPYARKLRLLTSGNVSLITTGGDAISYTGLAAGFILDWVAVSRVKQTGTSATLEAIY